MIIHFLKLFIGPTVFKSKEVADPIIEEKSGSIFVWSYTFWSFALGQLSSNRKKRRTQLLKQKVVVFSYDHKLFEALHWVNFPQMERSDRPNFWRIKLVGFSYDHTPFCSFALGQLSSNQKEWWTHLLKKKVVVFSYDHTLFEALHQVSSLPIERSGGPNYWRKNW